MTLGDDPRTKTGAPGAASSAKAALAEIQSLHRSGRAAKALEHCRAYLRHHPATVELLLTLARLEFDHGHPDEAMRALEHATRIDPRRIDTWVALGDACFAGRRFEAAADAYGRARELDPASAELAARVGAALQSAGRIEPAVTCYRSALANSPDDALLHYNLGTALKALHRFDEAVAEYGEALRLAPDNPDLKVRLGNLLVETSRFDEAVQLLQNALGEVPRSQRAFVCHLLAYAHKKLGQGKESVTFARQLVNLTDGAVPALMHLSAAYLTLGDAGNALSVCERALAREPASRQLLSDKALALAALGREQDAAYLYDFDQLLNVSRIDPPSGYRTVDAFNGALLEHIRTHPTLDFSGISLSCHEGATSDELLVDPKGPVAGLEAAIARAAAKFRAALPAEDAHPWIDNLPDQDRLELSAWVTRLRSQGYQHGHIHPSAWISGVYYVSLPPEVADAGQDQCGWIEFGRPPYYYACDSGHVQRSIQPREGMIVLFPSYFYHRTIPFTSDRERVTIAFDFRLAANGRPGAGTV